MGKIKTDQINTGVNLQNDAGTLESLSNSGGSLLTVDPQHPAAADDGDVLTPFVTIQAAVNAATDGDEIQVSRNRGVEYIEDLSISKNLSFFTGGSTLDDTSTNLDVSVALITGDHSITGAASVSLKGFKLEGSVVSNNLINFTSSGTLLLKDTNLVYTGNESALNFTGRAFSLDQVKITASSKKAISTNTANYEIISIRNSLIFGDFHADGNDYIIASDTIFSGSFRTVDNAADVYFGLFHCDLSATFGNSIFYNTGTGAVLLDTRYSVFQASSQPWAINSGGGTIELGYYHLVFGSNTQSSVSPGITLSPQGTVFGTSLTDDGSGTTQTENNFYIGSGTKDSSAAFEVDSTTQAFLPPRMTTAQRTAIPTPADGSVVYDTDENSLFQRANGAWEALGNGGVIVDSGSGSIQPGTTINFNKTFTSPPSVIVTYEGSSADFNMSAYNVTTTGFRYDEFRVNGSGSYTVLPIMWIAVGT